MLTRLERECNIYMQVNFLTFLVIVNGLWITVTYNVRD